ncbi:MAG: S41 family peptidase [Lysobacterales bacterium]
MTFRQPVAFAAMIASGLRSAAGCGARRWLVTLWLGTSAVAAPQPLPPTGLPEAAQGTWASDGYGWRLQVDARGARFSHAVGEWCWSAEDGDEWLSGTEAFELSSDAQQLALYATGEPHPYRFRRLDHWPATCDHPPSGDTLTRFDRFAALMQAHYAFFDRYQVDWSNRVRSARGRLHADSSDRRLFAALRSTLRGIDDAHLSVLAEVQGLPRRIEGNRGRTLGTITARARQANQPAGPYRRQWQREIWNAALGDARHEAGNEFLQWGWLTPDVGYLAAYAMGGYAVRDFSDPTADRQVLAQFLDEAMGAFEAGHARAVVLDLSLNHGGYDFLARDFASRFADRRRLAYRKWAADAVDQRPTELWIEPAEHRYTGPLYLLTSDITVSAGEISVLSLRAFPQVVHAGMPTRGALSDILSKNLDDGWSLNLSNEIYLDHEGVSWEGRGIPPTLALDVFPAANPDGGHAQALQDLLTRIAADLSSAEAPH